MTIDLHLSKAQLNKLKKGGSFQMNKNQIESRGCDKTCHCKVTLTDTQMKKLLRNLKSGKGFRIKDEHITGSGWWDDMKKGFQTVKGHLETAGNFIKDNVSQDDAKAILKTAVNVGTKLAGKEHLAEKINSGVDKGVDKGVDYGYSTKKKSLKNHAKDLKEIYQPEIDEGVSYAKEKAKQEIDKRFNKQDEQPTEGEGFKRKSKKGSPEMIERMAKLQTMRLKKGGSIWSDMASGLIHVGIPAVTSVVGDMIGGPVGGVAGAVAGNMGADAIGNATGYGLTSPDKIHTPYMTIIGGIPIPFHKSVRTTKDRRVIHGGSFLSI